MVQVVLPQELVDDLRPFVETVWETRQREENGVLISATEVIKRALEYVYAIKDGQEPMPAQVPAVEKPKRARLYGRRR